MRILSFFPQSRTVPGKAGSESSVVGFCELAVHQNIPHAVGELKRSFISSAVLETFHVKYRYISDKCLSQKPAVRKPQNFRGKLCHLMNCLLVAQPRFRGDFIPKSRKRAERPRMHQIAEFFKIKAVARAVGSQHGFFVSRRKNNIFWGYCFAQKSHIQVVYLKYF